ncbi:Leucine-rich_repeat protein [Hexamita inflata]|uniref:Leucine-rich repeat protein n=1 Tax=Hexamita inflata TaxID=28002 RepID=A0AA86PBS0_9EUKA|nr:Leucine-rich repeat protein [Hexamita inflata]
MQSPDYNTLTSLYQVTSSVIQQSAQNKEGVYQAFLSPSHRSITAVLNPHTITYLNLTRCHITTLEGVSSLQNVKFLFLDDNLISNTEQIATIPNLEILSLSFNPVTRIDFKQDTLQVLNLNNTKIQIVETANTPNLKFLSLQNCLLKEILPGASLHYIDLENTCYQDLERLSFIFPLLKQIDFQGRNQVSNRFFRNLQFQNDSEVNQQVSWDTSIINQKFWFSKYKACFQTTQILQSNQLQLRKSIYNLKNDLQDLRKQFSAQNYINEVEQNLINETQNNYQNALDLLQLLIDFEHQIIKMMKFQFNVADFASVLERGSLVKPAFENINQFQFKSTTDQTVIKIENEFMSKKMKQLLLEEIEIINGKVEYDVKKFQDHFNKNTETVVLTDENFNSFCEFRDFMINGRYERISSSNGEMFRVICKQYNFQNGVYVQPVYLVLQKSILSAEGFRGQITQFLNNIQQQIDVFNQNYDTQVNYITPGSNDLHNCGLTAVPELNHESLNLSFNQLKTATFDSQTLIELDLSNNPLQQLSISSPVVKLDISFTNLQATSWFNQIDQKCKQSLKELTCFGINVPINLIRNQFKNLEVLNGSKICSRTIEINSLFFDDYELQIENQSESLSNCQTQQQSKIVNYSNQAMLALPLQVIKQQNLVSLNLTNCHYFQTLGIKLKLKYLDVSNTFAVIDDLLQLDLDLIGLSACNCITNNTQWKQSQIKYLVIDNLQNFSVDFAIQQLQQFQQLEMLSIINQVNNNQYNVSLLQSLRKQSPDIKYLNTFTGEINEIALYLQKLQFYNSTVISLTENQKSMDSFTQCITNQLIEQTGIICQDSIVLDCTNLQSLLTFELKHKLVNLSVRGNRIKQLAVPKNIQVLDVSNNLISDPFPEIVSDTLTQLILQNNPIVLLKKPLNPPSFLNLIKLDLSGTKQCKALQSQSFSFLVNLKQLIMNDCSFINISNDALLGLKYLQELQLNGTSLRGLEILDGLVQYKNLKSLDIGNNKITQQSTLMKGIDKFNFQNLNVEGNPFCRTSYIDQVLESQLSSIIILNNQEVTNEQKQKIIDLIQAREEEMKEKMGMNKISFGGPPQKLGKPGK